ncbi:MAG: DUF1553 domain-containing protein [Acidobacteria bacterium]|nr:DUF1553 domain-containing protein [Acidobacteriota bacterium]
MRNTSRISPLRGPVAVAVITSALIVGGVFISRAQQAEDSGTPVLDADCPYFGALRKKTADQQMANGLGPTSGQYNLSRLTEEVVRQLPDLPASASQDGSAAVTTGLVVPGGSRTSTYQNLNQLPTIDRYVFTALQQTGVASASRTNDFEFIRRVTLDLTGRIPTMDRVLTFVVDTRADKRALLIEELLDKPEWVDKWTMYLGDLFSNSSRTTQINRFPEGRNAFYQWIHDSVADGKPYDQMARELISAQSSERSMEQGSFTIGTLNFMAGGVVTGGPVQDIWDQQTVNISQTFLGLSHIHCLLCHNGRGHLDALSLWGSRGTRMQAWQMSAFLSHAASQNNPVGDRAGHVYWTVQDDTVYRADYALNTTTGNRPARQSVNGVNRVAPVYWFSGQKPAPGENYRVAFAREATSDFQFARAAVNYIWKEFFGVGLVDPPDQFDPARLDPDNPPPAPWSLQPSNPRLLNALAQDFIKSNYDLKSLMRAITNSNAYQLSARYNGNWDPAWQNLYARKLVRRLWAEEIHDAIAQSSGLVPSYTLRAQNVTFGPVNWAMQFPETDGTPDNNGAMSQFLDAFLRGNRVDQERRGEGSPGQALGLMNNRFVMDRVHATGAAQASGLLARNLNLPDDQLVNTLFVAVLSRYPSETEMAQALANLKAGNRTRQAENLLWVLYNKIDFMFNY